MHAFAASFRAARAWQVGSQAGVPWMFWTLHTSWTYGNLQHLCNVWVSGTLCIMHCITLSHNP